MNYDLHANSFLFVGTVPANSLNQYTFYWGNHYVPMQTHSINLGQTSLTIISYQCWLVKKDMEWMFLSGTLSRYIAIIYLKVSMMSLPVRYFMCDFMSRLEFRRVFQTLVWEFPYRFVGVSNGFFSLVKAVPATQPPSAPPLLHSPLAPRRTLRAAYIFSFSLLFGVFRSFVVPNQSGCFYRNYLVMRSMCPHHKWRQTMLQNRFCGHSGRILTSSTSCSTKSDFSIF